MKIETVLSTLTTIEGIIVNSTWGETSGMGSNNSKEEAEEAKETKATAFKVKKALLDKLLTLVDASNVDQKVSTDLR